MTRSRSFVAGSAALALSFALAGCGGDSGLSAEEFRTQADKICADAEEKSGDLFAGLSASSSEADLVAALKKIADLLDEQSDKIDDLAAPADLEEKVEAMLESLREGADKIRDDGLALIKSGANPLAEATEKATDLGLEDCGSVT